MKKFLFILLILMFASSASASVYKWVDERGVVNYADDSTKVPPDYRDKVEDVSIPQYVKAGAPSGKTSTEAPPVAQPLVREGDFAIKLVEALKIGQAKSEAEAETMLVSAGIAPQNGWIADYPVTPDVIAELEKAIGEAADAGRLPMGREEALKAFRTAGVELELPIVAEVPDQYAESPPPATPQYTEPSVINNYYYTEGPPIVTYYPPPIDYYYLYAWIPSPFWYYGFYFPGFYILCDFHKVVYINSHAYVITNHIKDHRTGRIFAIHPERRYEGRPFGARDNPPTRGFNSAEARKGARSIFERSRQRAAVGNTTTPIKDRGRSNGRPAYSSPGRGTERQVYSQPSGFNGRKSASGKPPVVDRRTSRTPNQTGSHGFSNRTFSRPDSMNRQQGTNFQRPSPGETRSFTPPARGRARSFSSPPQGGRQRFNASPTGSRGFSGSRQGGNRGSFSPPARGSERSSTPPPRAGGKLSGFSSMGNRGFSGSHRGGDRGSGFGYGGLRF